MKRILSMLLALCLIVGLLPAVAIPHAHAEDEVLTEAIRVMHDWTIYASTNGASTYFVNQEVETTSSDGATFTGTTWAITGENRDNNGRTMIEPEVWNGKFEYPAGGIPTLYLKGARLDLLNEDTGNYNTSIKSTMYAIGGQSYEDTTPLKIVILEDSYIATNSYVYNDSSNNTDLYIESRNGATLKTECRMGITVPNGDLIIDANLDMFMPKWAGDNCHLLCTSSADGDIVINGGNISLKSTITDYTSGANCNNGTTGWTGPASIAMRTRGETADITINGGNLSIDTRYAVAVNTHGAIQTDGANAVITVNGGDVNIQSNNLGVIKSVQPIIINDGSFTGVAAKQFALLSATASKVIMKGGRLSLEGHGSRGSYSGQCSAYDGTCLDLTQYNGAYVLKYGKPTDGAAVTEVNKTSLDGIYYRPYITVTPYCEEKGHTEVIIPGTVTCTEPGLCDGVTCSVCGKVLVEQTEVPAGHKEVEVERVEPTTTTVGTTAGTKCSVCGEILSGCEEIPMLRTASVKIMNSTTLTVIEGGEAKYAKSYSGTAYNAAGKEIGLYWASTTGSADNWNVKFEYPMGGVPTLTFKDATFDYYDDDGNLMYTKNDGTGILNYAHSGVFPNSVMTDLKIILQGTNHIDVGYGIIRHSYTNNGVVNCLGNITVIGEEGSSLSGSIRSAGGFNLSTGYDLALENVNLDVSSTYEYPLGTKDGDITINGGNLKINNSGNACINADAGNVIINNAVIEVSNTFKNGETNGAGAINAKTGSLTITNSTISGVSTNGLILYGNTALTINGGTYNLNGCNYSMSSNLESGVVAINGGEIEASARSGLVNGTLDLSGYEGWYAVGGANKDSAVAITDAANLKKPYVKISAEPICDHTNTTTTEEIITEATCTAAGSKKVTVTCECGEVISTETVEIAALGHTEETVAGKAATCTEAGLTDGTVCSVCGETVVAQTEIPALGHTAGAAVKENEVEADLNNEGSYDSVVYCDLCGAEMSRETVETPVKEGAVAEAGGLKYATLTEAIAAGGEVTLLDNITANALYKITAGQDVILNLNTKTITAVDGRLFIISVEVGGKLTINGEGGIINNNAYGYAIVNKGELIVNGGDIVGDYALYNGDFALTAKATLNGGTFSANEGAFYSVANCSELIVNGATLNDWVNTSAKFTVESGKIENLYVGVADKAVASGVATAINGGEIAALYAADTEKSPVTKGEGVTIEAPEGYCWNAENVLGEHAHTAVVTEATCTEAGFTTYTCAHCGDTYTADEVAALGHTEEVIPGKAATCTEAGLTEGKKCTVCGETTVEQEEIPATGHVNTTETVTIVDATCTAAGSKTTTVTCACGEVVSTTTEEIPVLPHTEEIIPGKEASCTEPGLTEGKKCSVCGEILVAQEEIAALGHSYAGDAATECAVCGAARATVTVVDDEVTVNTNGMTNVKVHAFNITDKEIADIDVWNDLKAADPDFKTYSKNPFELANGTYVLRVQYDDADGVMQAVSYQVTIDYTPAAVTPPTIEINGNAVSVNNNGLTGVVVYAFNVTGKEVADIDVWNDLKAADPAFKTYTKNAFVLENGDYVLRVQYSNADGDKLTESHAVPINYTPGEPTATVGGKTVTVEGENVQKVHVFYVGGQEIADIDDWYQLKAADSTFKSYRKKQFAVKHSGKYVLRVEYADEHGVARKASLTITVA